MPYEEHYQQAAAFDKATGFLIRTHPEWATQLGEHSEDEKLSNLSDGAVAVYERGLIDAHGLVARPEAHPDAERDRLLLRSFLEHERFRYATLRDHATDPLLHVDLASTALSELVLKPFAPVSQRLAAATARARLLPSFFATATAVLDRPPQARVEKAIELCEGLASFVDDLPRLFQAEAARYAAGEDPAPLLAALDEAACEAGRSVRAFRVHLADKVLLRAPVDFALGERNFLRKLRYQEMVDLDVAALERRYDAERRRLAELLAEAVSECGYASPGEAFAALARDRFTAATLLDGARGELERLERFVRERELMEVPEAPACQVLETPRFAWGFASLNPAGVLETAAVPSTYYVTAVRPEWPGERQAEHLGALNRAVLAVVSAHEVTPGHHLQQLWQLRAGSRLRKMLQSTAFVEGWAHYAEELLIEEGYAAERPTLKLAMLSEALLRLARYRASLGLHVEGWTVARAQELFEKEAHLPPSWALEEARRGTFDPLYLVYTLGKMLLRELRAEMKAKEGAGFRLKVFHDRILAQGAPPLPLLRQALVS